MNLENCNAKYTPLSEGTLPKDTEGAPCNEAFNYPSVLEMLLYVHGHSRPDMSFAVS